MGFGEQVTRPGRDAAAIGFIVTVDAPVEVRQRGRVAWRGVTQNQPVAQVANEKIILHGSPLSLTTTQTGRQFFKSCLSWRMASSGPLKWTVDMPTARA